MAYRLVGLERLEARVVRVLEEGPGHELAEAVRLLRLLHRLGEFGQIAARPVKRPHERIVRRVVQDAVDVSCMLRFAEYRIAN